MCCGYLKYKAKSGKNTGLDIIIDKDRVLNWYLLGFNIFHAVEYSIYNLYSEILSPYVVSCARALLFTFALSHTHSFYLSPSLYLFLSISVSSGVSRLQPNPPKIVRDNCWTNYLYISDIHSSLFPLSYRKMEYTRNIYWLVVSTASPVIWKQFSTPIDYSLIKIAYNFNEYTLLLSNGRLRTLKVLPHIIIIVISCCRAAANETLNMVMRSLICVELSKSTYYRYCIVHIFVFGSCVVGYVFFEHQLLAIVEISISSLNDKSILLFGGHVH